MAPESVEILLLGDERAEVRVEVQRGRQGVERLRAVAGQAPVARQVIVQEGFVGVLASARSSESIACARRLVRL